MEQQQGGGGRISSLPVENFNAIDIGTAVNYGDMLPFYF